MKFDSSLPPIWIQPLLILPEGKDFQTTDVLGVMYVLIWSPFLRNGLGVGCMTYINNKTPHVSVEFYDII